MKQRSTTPVSKSLAVKSTLVAAAVLMAIAAPIQMGPIVRADKYDAQIKALQNEIAGYNAEAAKLAEQADSLKAELAKLSAEKATIQTQIELSEAKLAQLKQQIEDTEKKILDNQDALGETIANMYVSDTITPLEMLASSKNIGDYLDKQTYRSAIRDELTKTIDTIEQLKKDLEAKRQDVERTLSDQENQRQALASKEQERQTLLAETNGKEAAYQELSSEKRKEVDSLRAQQAAEIAARAQAGGGGTFQNLGGDPNRGGYPSMWANAPMNAYVDSWGMYSRQCVSYAAFKVNQAYGNMPYWGGIGNANQWGNNARASGIKVSATPAVGTVGVLYDGPYGHVGWVEAVHGDGTITISQYNAGWSGEYSVWRVSSSFFQEYIYFGG